MTAAIYRCWAEIDRSALRHNAAVVRERIGSAELLAVVKADAYGHGLIGVAQALANDAQLFGVANLEEAIAVRNDLSHTIIILGPALSEERSTIVERGNSTFASGSQTGTDAANAPANSCKVRMTIIPP